MTEVRDTHVIGLLGGIGSGKSAAARLLAGWGAHVIDADRMAHDVLKEPPVKEQIRAAWGDGVFDAHGEVDRGRLAEAVFGCDGPLERLNEIVHPRVIEKTRQTLAQCRRRGQDAVIDAPLLIEAGLDGLCDTLIFIDCHDTQRTERTHTQRDWPPSELERRERRQASLTDKRNRAHFVVDNSQGIDDTTRQLRRIWQQMHS